MEVVLTNVQIPMGPFIVHAIMALILLKMIDTNALVSNFYPSSYHCCSISLAYYTHR